MDTRTFIVTNQDETTEQMVSIDWGNGQHTSMSKATYDAQLASQENN